MILNIYLFSIS